MEKEMDNDILVNDKLQQLWLSSRFGYFEIFAG